MTESFGSKLKISTVMDILIFMNIQGCIVSEWQFYMSRKARNRSSGFLTRSDTNQPVHLQKMSRSLKFWIKEEEEMYHPCSENKDTDTDQLCSYFTADLLLCFRIGKNPVFS